MLKDCFGHTVSTDDDAALAAVNDFIQGFLRYETRAAKVLAAAGRDCALANTYCGLLMLLLEAPDAPSRAAPHLEAARAQIDAATPRETFTLDYAEAWLKAQQHDDYAPVLHLGEEARKTFPQDLALMKLHQYHCFNAGDAPAMLRAAQAAHAHHPQVPQVYGMLAFGYEHCHSLAEAEDAAKTARSLETKTRWAQQAMATRMPTQGRLADGARLGDATVEAVRGRVRPIFMSSLTSLAGLAPLVLFPGSGSELYRGVGAIVLGGLALSTALTLFVVPALFSLIWRVRRGINP